MMRLTLQFQDGTSAEALILAADGNQIRVVVDGNCSDTEQWLMLNGRWYDEDGGLVEIGSLVALGETDCLQVFAAAYPRTATAGAFSGLMA
jgi:hypothetical protein